MLRRIIQVRPFPRSASAGGGRQSDGEADFNTPKGKDAAGHDTHTELIIRPLLKLDIGRLVGRKERVLEAGVGFQSFHNMFGEPPPCREPTS